MVIAYIVALVTKYFSINKNIIKSVKLSTNKLEITFPNISRYWNNKGGKILSK